MEKRIFGTFQGYHRAESLQTRPSDNISLNSDRSGTLMSDFNKLCKIMEEMDPATYTQIVTEKSVGIIKGLADITEDGLSGVSIYADFIMCAVAADGKLTEEEYLLIKPVLDLILQRDVSFDDARKIFYMAGLDKPKDYKKSMDHMVDVIGLVSPDLKDDIVLVCMMICAIDGKISYKEKKWIKQLIE